MSDPRAVLEAPAYADLPVDRAKHTNGSRPSGKDIVVVRELGKVFVKRKVNPDAPAWSRLLPFRQRSFEQAVAVDQVSFSIRGGEIFGLLGPS